MIQPRAEVREEPLERLVKGYDGKILTYYSEEYVVAQRQEAVREFAGKLLEKGQPIETDQAWAVNNPGHPVPTWVDVEDIKELTQLSTPKEEHG